MICSSPRCVDWFAAGAGFAELSVGCAAIIWGGMPGRGGALACPGWIIVGAGLGLAGSIGDAGVTGGAGATDGETDAQEGEEQMFDFHRRDVASLKTCLAGARLQRGV